MSLAELLSQNGISSLTPSETAEAPFFYQKTEEERFSNRANCGCNGGTCNKSCGKQNYDEVSSEM